MTVDAPGSRPAPALSVVVAVYDVEPWIAECLESVAAVVPPDAEVIIVDDGSTDASSQICDRAAAHRSGWRVVHQPNAGLGAARNAGLDLARGEYVGFVDGDDLLLPAYAELVPRAVASDASVATGAVNRTDGVHDWPSGLHSQALDGLGASAALATDLSLVYDTTAWNKVYRRSFLEEHGLRFPEGVLYEDLPFTIPALHHAGTVAVVHDPVYRWRSRQGGLSITQRRNELANLTDRFAAVSAVDRFLAEHDLADARAHHDLKVLRLDLPLYTAALPEADDAFRDAYLRFVAQVASHVSREQRASLPPTLRLYLELAEAGRMHDLEVVVRARRGERAWARDDRGRVDRVRDIVRSFGIERELALSPAPKLARRLVSSLVKTLLPSWLRSALGGWRRRRAGARRAGVA